MLPLPYPAEGAIYYHMGLHNAIAGVFLFCLILSVM